MKTDNEHTFKIKKHIVLVKIKEVYLGPYYNMDIKNLFVVLLTAAAFSGTMSCNIKGKSIDEMAFKAKRDHIKELYPKIPHDEILQQITSSRLYGDLQESYSSSLISLKMDVERDSAKLVVVILSPQVGNNANLANTYGIPYIVKSCGNMGLDCYDLSKGIEQREQTEITQSTQETAWTKEGAVYVAGMLDSIIRKYGGIHCSNAVATQPKPATFGDLPPNDNEVIEDESLTYHIKVNAQGLRLDHNITFPKQKQTILLLGDSKIYCPYLDNEATIAAVLQKRFPDKVIISDALTNYSMDDYESLYKDKARFTEPDVVIVFTDGDDILKQYFSQRNRYSRRQKIYAPTAVEEEFYHQLYGK